MSRIHVAVVGVMTIALAAHVSAELQPATLAAYERYVAATERRITAEREGRAPFLWIDQQSAAERARALERLRRGEILLTSLETRENGTPIRIPNGLVHHWLGTVFLPGVSLDRVTVFVQDYDRYPHIFDPLIQRARVTTRTGDRFVVAMRTSVKKVVSAVMEADYTVEYHAIGPDRRWTTTVATNVHQVHNAGTRSERREPGDQAAGYLWRFRMYCAFEARDGGSIEQCESVTLTRAVPAVLSWVVGPFVTGIPRDTMELTLARVRANLLAAR